MKYTQAEKNFKHIHTYTHSFKEFQILRKKKKKTLGIIPIPSFTAYKFQNCSLRERERERERKRTAILEFRGGRLGHGERRS